MEKCGQLYPPFLVPRGPVAQVHQVLHLLHCFDGGHLDTVTKQSPPLTSPLNLPPHPSRVKGWFYSAFWIFPPLFIHQTGAFQHRKSFWD